MGALLAVLEFIVRLVWTVCVALVDSAEFLFQLLRRSKETNKDSTGADQ